MSNPISPMRRNRFRPLSSVRALLLCGAATLTLLPSLGHAETDGSLRVLTFNTWGDQFRNNLDAIMPLFTDGGYDIIAFQELGSTAYLSGLQQRLRDAGMGEYTYVKSGDTGILTRVPGALGANTLGDSVAYVTTDAAGGTPETVFGSVHLNYYDTSDARLNEIAGITTWAKSTNRSVVLVGDFNAGDVSERGLNRASQQKLILQNYLRSGNAFYGTLLEQYAVDPEAMTKFIAEHSGERLSLDDIPDDLFADEMYPVEDNIPVSMNKLKRDFILLQTEEKRELFAPHELGDGKTTWTSVEEDHTNTWPSWDRVVIDHFIASRPFGKWWKIVDDAADDYTGVLDQTDVTDSGKAFSDHELVAHDLAWVGPKLDYYDNAEGTEETRLVWSEEATVFEEHEGEFYLTRNNMRTDVYLGQVSDENGNPILDWLTEDEKKTLLDCTSTDARLQDAIIDYCIDDHSFISETLVADGGTVRVDEDAALGNSDAALRLNDGGLAVSGTAMTSLNREVSLEGTGGWLDIREANATVFALQDISGTGALDKRGNGTLVLEADNSYTGATQVSKGLLVVNGSIANSQQVTVGDGAAIGGSGTVGSLTLGSGATLAAGNSIGALTVDGDLAFAAGSSFEIEVNAAGESDVVNATGNIAIAGGSAFALAAPGDYKPFTDYTVLTAGGTVTGQFDSVTSSLAFLDASLSYGTSDVSLTLERNDTAFDQVAKTANRRATAGGVESLGYGNALYNEVVMLDAGTADTAFDDLSGELHAATLTTLAEQSNTLRGVALGQMRNFAGGDKAQFWMQTYGGASQAEADDLHQLNSSNFGTLVGVNGMLDSGWTYGAMAGYGQSEARLSGADSDADTQDVNLGVFGGRAFGAAHVTAGLTWTNSQIDSTRGVDFGGFADTLTADYSANTTQVFAELAYDFAMGSTVLQPYAGIAHIAVKTDGTTEDGGAAALKIAGNDYEATITELGVRAESLLTQGATPIRLSGELGWQHVLDASNPTADMAFAGGSSFGIDGAGLPEDLFKVNLSVAAELTEQTSLQVGYTGSFGDAGHGNSLGATLRVNF
ncbi:autotransporter domain-containing protein [Frigidibacter sp.]|uniref:autotransporter domain-containing protein n=1 Tax=Frigidibacter sp. TaxID=2586418 RepID=UPI00273582A8|nr:autotransporter domain-containing protein [Frigidibacter sp.]MDP3340542.1 autotransporter domain-containing protein [Frigidibacter sp.]